MRTTKCVIGAIVYSVVFSLPAFAQENAKLSDAEVASVAVIANQIDIAYADIARERSKNDEIRKFAETMTNDHRAVISQASALVKKLGVTPQDNSVGRKLLADAENIKKQLRAAPDNQFDKKYIDNEVAYHKAVIAAVEGLLIPETENVELKELLNNVVPALKTHLAHAEMVQKKF
jgi:putative membrane protein